MENIPKIAHFYWGNTVLPFLRYLTLYSFRSLNPDWIIKLHTSKNISLNKSWDSGEQQFNCTAKDYIEYINRLNIEIVEHNFSKEFDNNDIDHFHEVIKSDILRWKLLSEEGGFWSDMDILYIKSMNNFLSGKEKFDTFICDNNGYYSIGFLLSNRNNPYYDYIYRKSKDKNITRNYQCFGNILLKQNFNSFQDISSYFSDISIYNIPMNIVYPHDWINHDKIFKVSSYNIKRKPTYKERQMMRRRPTYINETENIKEFDEQTIGLHWFGGSEIAGEYQSLLNDKTFNAYDIVICKYIKLIWKGDITI